MTTLHPVYMCECTCANCSGCTGDFDLTIPGEVVEETGERSLPGNQQNTVPSPETSSHEHEPGEGTRNTSPKGLPL